MSLTSALSWLYDDRLALRILALGEITEVHPYRVEDENVNFLTVLYIIAGTLAATFSARALLDRPQDLFYYLLYIAFLTLGIGIAALMGTRAHAERITGEGFALAVGLVAYSVILVIQYSFSLFAGVFLFNQLEFSMAVLAPISETLFFTVVLYRVLRVALPALNWMFANSISSVVFALYHYFVYGADWLSMLILFFGNTVLNFSFEITKNPAAPMTAHLLVNITPFWGTIVSVLASMWWLMLIPFLFTFLFVLAGGMRK